VTKQKKSYRLARALLEAAHDMPRIGVLTEQTHEKITLRHSAEG
jgi:hypothetical protein